MEIEDLNQSNNDAIDEGKFILQNLSKFHFMKDFNPDDYEINKDLPAKKFYINEKLNTKCLGIVIYMDKSRYTNEPEKDKHIHFPFNNKAFGLVILKWFESLIPNQKPKELIVNHEHGDQNKKCHKQIFIKFNSKIQCHLRPSYFDLNNQRYLCMGQAANSEVKLRNYCMKKDEVTKERFFAFDFSAQLKIQEYIDLVEKDGINELNEAQIKMKDQTLDKLFEVEKLDDKTYCELYKEAGPHAKSIMIRDRKNILELRSVFDKIKAESKEYTWHFPQYAIDYTGTHVDNLSRVYSSCYKWFNKYCVNNDPNDHSLNSRKKALLIFGLRRKGKTTFIKSFIEDINTDVAKSPAIVYCRQNITAKNFMLKEDSAKLLILDDIHFIDKQKEMIKALMVGETVNIESKFVDNYIWSKSIPCVILTNNPYLYHYLTTSIEFKTELHYIATSCYLGPEGSEPVDEESFDYEDDDMRRMVEEILEQKKERKGFND